MDLYTLFVSLLYVALGLGVVIAGKMALSALNYVIDKNDTVSWIEQQYSDFSSRHYKLEERLSALENKKFD